MTDFNYCLFSAQTGTVCVVKADSQTDTGVSAMITFLKELCLHCGSTLDGRFKAWNYLSPRMHYPPLLLHASPPELLLPTGSRRDPDTIWISYSHLKRLDVRGQRVFFDDGTWLAVEHPERIKKQLRQIAAVLNRLRAIRSPGSLPCSSSVHDAACLHPVLQCRS